MADVTLRFRQKLEELCALGRRSGMRLSVQQIQSAMEGEHLLAEHLQLIYHYLDEMSIEIYDPDLEEESASRDVRKRSLELYLEELDRLTPLDEETEYQLFGRAAEGDREAAHALIERYLPTVCDLASEYERADTGDGKAATGRGDAKRYRKPYRMEAEDLAQEANTGLVMGVSALEKETSLTAYRAKLLNYVTSYLEKSVRNLEEMMNSDTRVVNRMNALADTVRTLEEELGHKPSIGEVSAFLEIPAEDIRNLLRVAGDDLKIEDSPEG